MTSSLTRMSISWVPWVTNSSINWCGDIRDRPLDLIESRQSNLKLISFLVFRTSCSCSNFFVYLPQVGSFYFFTTCYSNLIYYQRVLLFESHTSWAEAAKLTLRFVCLAFVLWRRPLLKVVHTDLMTDFTVLFWSLSVVCVVFVRVLLLLIQYFIRRYWKTSLINWCTFFLTQLFKPSQRVIVRLTLKRGNVDYLSMSFLLQRIVWL